MGGGKKKGKNDNDFRVTPLHVDNEVTASSVLVEVDNLKILLDFGSYQSQSKTIESRYKINSERLGILNQGIDYIILSSVHLDHSGMLGLIGRQDVEFNGNCICTELSQELIALNLYDGAFLMEKECEVYNKNNKKEQLKPLYDTRDVDRALSYLRGYGYNEKIYLSETVYVKLIPNAHICGDCSIYITYEKDEYTKKTLLYLGDHNYGKKQSKPFTMEWKKEIANKLKPTMIITEATYGGEIQKQENYIDELEKYIMSEVIEKKRTLFIPSFAISRSTEIAYGLKKIWERNEVIRNSDIPIFMCGLMTSKCHRIIGNPKHKCFYDEKWQNEDELFEWDKIRIVDNFKDVQSKCLNQSPKILIASSGMCVGGYSKFLLSCYVTQKNCSILFTGYQAIQSEGRRVLEGEHKTISIDGKAHIIRATVLGSLSMSGHADNKGLVGIFDTMNLHNLKKVLIIHGEDSRKFALKECLDQKFKDSVEVIVPKAKQSFKF